MHVGVVNINTHKQLSQPWMHYSIDVTNGKKASHIVVIQMIFELYDIFIDVSYIIELFSHKYYNLFIIFTSSFGLTLIVNGIFVVVFLLISVLLVSVLPIVCVEPNILFSKLT